MIKLATSSWDALPDRWEYDGPLFSDWTDGFRTLRSLDSVQRPQNEKRVFAAYQAGKHVADDLPNEAQPVGPDLRYSQPRDIFRLKSGYLVVSRRMWSTLRQFDIGSTRAYPLRINWRPHQQWDRDFHILQVCEVKDTLMPDWSFIDDYKRKKACLPPEPCLEGEIPGPWTIQRHWNGVFALSKQALQGSDLWFEERLSHGPFLSSRLRQALREAKLRLFGGQPTWIPS